MTQLTLFGPSADKPTRPTASDAVLLLLCHLAHHEHRGYYTPLGSPAIGWRTATIESAVAKGWVIREHTGDSDTEGGPRRLRLTDSGADQVAAERAYAKARGFRALADSIRYAEDGAA